MADFSPAFEELLKWEGREYVNDPADPGGGTKFGISSRAYPDLDIRHLTAQDAAVIYRRDYWNPLQLDKVRDQTVASRAFNIGVNLGTVRGAKVLQVAVNRFLGCRPIPVDGRIGPQTLGAVNRQDAVALDAALRVEQGRYYLALVDAKPALGKFLHGWMNRALS